MGKRGPRPSSVVCPVCSAPLSRACVEGAWRPGVGGNTLGGTHPERRALAIESEGGEPDRRARAARKSLATMRLADAVVDAIRAGVTNLVIKLVVRDTLSARASHQVSESSGAKTP